MVLKNLSTQKQEPGKCMKCFSCPGWLPDLMITFCSLEFPGQLPQGSFHFSDLYNVAV